MAGWNTQVRCIVRPRQNPADFLRDWGATTVQADLQDPTSLPAALVGIHTVIDCATARPEESTQKVDWDGKVALIQCAQVGASTLSCQELCTSSNGTVFGTPDRKSICSF